MKPREAGRHKKAYLIALGSISLKLATYKKALTTHISSNHGKQQRRQGPAREAAHTWGRWARVSPLFTLCLPPGDVSAYKPRRGCVETACREWGCPPVAPPLAAAAAGIDTLHCASTLPVCSLSSFSQLPQLQHALPRQWRCGGGRFHRGAGRSCHSAMDGILDPTNVADALARAVVQIPNIEGRQYPPELAGGQWALRKMCWR